jgi:hypothetical protein
MNNPGCASPGWTKMANLAEDGAQQAAIFAIFILSRSPEFPPRLPDLDGPAMSEATAEGGQSSIEDLAPQVAAFASRSGLVPTDCPERDRSLC